jgi:hypothetical protein
MVVRICFARGAAVRRSSGKNRRLAWAAGALLTPAALAAFALAMWRLAADLGVAGEFAIPEGLLSHWQVWLVLAGLLEFSAWRLNHYGRAEEHQAVLEGSPAESRPRAPAPGLR